MLTPVERRGLLILMRPHLKARANIEAGLDLAHGGRRAGGRRHTVRPEPSPGSLTGAERRVLRLFAEGATDRGEVARQLGVSVCTVDAHTKQIRLKLGVRRTADAAAAARSHGVL